MRLALEPAGWVVHTWTSRGGRLKLIRNHKPSVVLFELPMPETDGFEVVDMLRRDRRLSRCGGLFTAKTFGP